MSGHTVPVDPTHDHHTHHTHDTDQALTPEQSAALVTAQRQRAKRQLEPSSVFMLTIWAIAWFAGYLVLWLRNTDRLDMLPSWLPGTIFAVLMMGALAATAWNIARHTRGVSGRSSYLGAGYTLAWVLGWAAMSTIGMALNKAGATADQLNLYWSLTPAALVGVMYLTGALIWPEWSWFATGALITASTVAAAFTGPITCLLVMSLAGGGSMAIGAVAAWAAGRRPQQA